jgi:hypothetical protein
LMNIEDTKTQASWDKIRQFKIKKIYPGHGKLQEISNGGIG